MFLFHFVDIFDVVKLGNFICNCILLKMEEKALNLVRDIYGMRVTWCFKKKKNQHNIKTI